MKLTSNSSKTILNDRRSRRYRLLTGLGSALLCLGMAVPVLAATSTWSGAGSDANWSTSANWGGTVPASGATLTFSGSTQQTNVNDLTLSDLGLVTFSTAKWNISGAAVSKTDNFTANVTGTSIWGLDTELKATVAFNQNKGSGILVLPGVLSGAGGISKPPGSTGQGRLRLLNTANTFTGSASLESGITEVMLFAPGGSPSSLGADSSTIAVGTFASAYAAQLNYIGTIDSGTDRAVTWAQRQANTVIFNNNSPSNAGVSFSGAWVCSPYQNPFTLRLTGTSTGTNLIAGYIRQDTTSLPVSLEVYGPGTWIFQGDDSLAGSFLVRSGTTILSTNTSGSVMNLSCPTIVVTPGALLDVSSFSQVWPNALLIGSAGVAQTLTAGSTNGATSMDICGSVNCGYGADRKLIIGGVGIPATLTISSNLVPNMGTLLFDLSNTTEVGGGTNDFIVVGGDLDLSQGVATVGVRLTKDSVQLNTPYTLIKYSGSLIGSAAGLSVPSPARAYTAGIVSTDTPGEVRVTFAASGLPPADLVWLGDGGGNSWDVGVSYNWLQHSTSDLFYSGDNVTFDDSSANYTVSLDGSLSPTLMTISTTNLYSFASASGGAIVGGSVVKTGSGELAMSTANLYAGGTVVSAGTVSARNNTALGSGIVQLGDASSGTNAISLMLASGATVANAVTVSSNGTGPVTLGRESGNSCGFDGPITLQRRATVSSLGPPTSNTGSYLRGNISGTGDVEFTGGGMFWVYGANTFTGNVYVTPGRDAIEANNPTFVGLYNSQAIPDTANVDLGTNTLLNLVASETINALTGIGTVTNQSGSQTLTVGGGNGSGTFSGNLATHLGKTGTGTQVLTGDNSAAAGNTAIFQGVLAVNNSTGSGLCLGTVTVAADGTLAGNGSINSGTKTVTVSGTLLVGNSGDTAAATFILANTGGLIVNSGGALSVDIFNGAGAGDNTGNPAAADVLNAQCPVTLNAGAVLTVTNLKGLTGWAIGDKWKIINWSSTPTGTFTSFNLPALGAGKAWDVSKLYTTGVIAVMAMPIFTAASGDGSLTLSWTDSATLQAAPEVIGAYTNVPGAASPFVITNFSEPSMFYRLRVP